MTENPTFEVSRTSDCADGSAPVVLVAGEVDIATAPVLAETIREAMTTGPPRVVVDLGAVEFIDASGIEVLIAAANAASVEGTAVVIRHAGERVRRVLDILQLDGTLPVEEDPDRDD